MYGTAQKGPSLSLITEMTGSYDVITWGHLHVYHKEPKIKFYRLLEDVYSEG